MTPTEHATAAADLLAAAADDLTITDWALDEITAHAVLSRAAGTGTHYVTADQLLTEATTAKSTALAAGQYARLARLALAHAHLADQ